MGPFVESMVIFAQRNVAFGEGLGSSVWRCVAVCCSVAAECVAVWCSVLQRVAVCCSVMQCVAM